MTDFDDEAEQLAEAAAEADNNEEIVYKRDIVKEKYFRYLLNEVRRNNISLNKKVSDEINLFMKSKEGYDGLKKFKLSKLYRQI